VQFQRQARLPLRVGHLEQVDLGDRAGDIEQRVDAAECGHGLVDYRLGGGRLCEVDADDERLGAGGFHPRRRLFEMAAVPGDEDERREVARQADGRRPADALTRAGDERD